MDIIYLWLEMLSKAYTSLDRQIQSFLWVNTMSIICQKLIKNKKKASRVKIYLSKQKLILDAMKKMIQKKVEK